MINSVSLQYAKAIFDLACEKKCATDYYQALEVINKAMVLDEEVVKVFAHPLVNKESKKELILKTLNNNTDELLIQFLFVLIDNNRFLDLPLVIEAYKQLLNDYENKMEVKVYSKYPLSDETLNKLKEKLEMHYHKTILLEVILDDSLIGGVKIVSDKEIIDSSILSTLDDLKNSLKKGW